MCIGLCYGLHFPLYRRSRSSFGWDGVISEWLSLEWIGRWEQVHFGLCCELHTERFNGEASILSKLDGWNRLAWANGYMLGCVTDFTLPRERRRFLIG